MTRKYGGATGVPRPPDPIWHELAEAGKAGDQIRIDRAAGEYRKWLTANGYYVPLGSQKPDEVER